jgi:D-amino peptidase
VTADRKDIKISQCISIIAKQEEAMLILSDMEGIGGIIDSRLLCPGDPFWRSYGRYLLTEEVNAVAIALFYNGIKKIYLSEAHNIGRNTVTEDLFPFITVLPPHIAQSNMHGISAWEELYGKKNIKGAIMVGCYGKAGSKGVFAHSLDGGVFERIAVNGEEVGDIALPAGLLGYYNIPLIEVVGDEAAIMDAKRIIPEITGVVVKRAENDGWIAALPPDIVQKKICEGTIKSLKKRPAPFRFDEPVDLSFEVRNEKFLERIPKNREVEIEINGKSMHVIAQDYLKVYDAFWNVYSAMIGNQIKEHN